MRHLGDLEVDGIGCTHGGTFCFAPGIGKVFESSENETEWLAAWCIPE